MKQGVYVKEGVYVKQGVYVKEGVYNEHVCECRCSYEVV